MPTTPIPQQLAAVPTTPGVYFFRDVKNNLLYVGKAKVLRTRVRSYFRPQAVLEPPKQHMVKQITSIETVSCDTETEALILEANLIRQHKPPYNVVLTDDKYYLFIKITREKFPRVFPVRRIVKDGARYFGPYSSSSAVRHTLKLLRRIFPHFTDQAPEGTWLFPHPLFARSSNPGQSTTVEAFDEAQYQENIRNIIRFLEGKREQIMRTLREGMRAAAKEKAYERAALWRDQLRAIEKLEGSQKVYLPRAESFDVVSIVSRESRSAANVFSVREGKLLQKNTFKLNHRMAASVADVLRQFLLQYYSVAQDIPSTILIPEPLTDQAALAQWINSTTPPALVVPQRGKKRQLLKMGELNAEQLLKSEEIEFETTARMRQAANELATFLKLDPATLHRIETYDISNIQGKLATGSMVVFVDGESQKSQYKRFRIRVGEEPNDFAMMQEVLERRFSTRHGVGEKEGWPSPDLIIIDGGKGQLSAAGKVLSALSIDVPIISLAKREEEVFVPGHKTSLRLPYDSDALYLLQRMRDEAHRFTITYHRLLRSKRASRSLLDEVPGIGPKLKKKLLAHFGSVKAIRAASTEQLAAIIGEQNAERLQEYL